MILADKFKEFAQYYYQQQEWSKAENSVRHAEHYYKKAKKDLEVASMQSLKADIFVERGRLCDIKSEQWLSVSYWYNDALNIYNTIPLKYKEVLKIAEKIEAVQKLIFQLKPLINNSMPLLGFIDYMGSIINCYRLVINEAHPKTEEDFFNLVQQSSIVPPVDQSLYAKALYLGYIGDLYTAIYLLAPKIENLFRIYLNNKGVTVLKTDSQGNETYVVLDRLLDEAQKQEGFDNKFIDVLRKVFTQRGGAQIRHRVAHGLLNDDDSEHMLVYAWALGLKMVLLFIDQGK